MKVSIIPWIVKKLKLGLALVEDGDTASQNIASGKYVSWKGNMCTASSAISSGDALSSSNLTAVDGGALNALNGKIPIAPDWSNGTECCTVSATAYTAPSNGWVKVSHQYDRGMQLNINSVVVFYVSPSYWGTSGAHAQWLVPVKKGDQIKLIADNGTLPSGMSAVFYPARTA